jgi:hypothetical protein
MFTVVDVERRTANFEHHTSSFQSMMIGQAASGPLEAEKIVLRINFHFRRKLVCLAPFFRVVGLHGGCVRVADDEVLSLADVND